MSEGQRQLLSKATAAAAAAAAAAPTTLLHPPPPPCSCPSLPEDLLARIREELTGVICFDLATRPATLPCGHSACRSVRGWRAVLSACRVRLLVDRRSSASARIGLTPWPAPPLPPRRRCLNAALAVAAPADKRRCPTCRAQLPIGLPPLALNSTLKNIAELLLPGGCRVQGEGPGGTAAGWAAGGSGDGGWRWVLGAGA